MSIKIEIKNLKIGLNGTLWLEDICHHVKLLKKLNQARNGEVEFDLGRHIQIRSYFLRYP